VRSDHPNPYETWFLRNSSSYIKSSLPTPLPLQTNTVRYLRPPKKKKVPHLPAPCRTMQGLNIIPSRESRSTVVAAKVPEMALCILPSSDFFCTLGTHAQCQLQYSSTVTDTNQEPTSAELPGDWRVVSASGVVAGFQMLYQV